MAALHLATLPNEEKLKVVEARAKSGRFNMVWRFMFGLASKHNGSRSDKVISLDDGLMDQFLMTKQNNVLALCHLAFETSVPVFAKKVCKMCVQNLLYDNFNTPFDCVAKFYVLRHAAQGDKMDISFGNDCAINDKLLKELSDILSNGKLKVTSLSFIRTKLSDKGIVDLFKRASTSFATLSYLQLKLNDLMLLLRVSGIQSLETVVQSGTLINLKQLVLTHTLTDDADVNGALLTTLLQSIASHCAGLRCLSLSNNILGLPGLCSIVENIPLRMNRIHLSNTHITYHFISH